MCPCVLPAKVGDVWLVEWGSPLLVWHCLDICNVLTEQRTQLPQKML